MDTFDTILNRRSIRQFEASVIPKEDLIKIVNAGRLAATGSNKQPWDFIVVTDRAMINRFKSVRRWIGTASAVIVVVMDPKSRWWVQDGSAAIENMCLASTALGYGSCWVEGDVLLREEEIKLILGIPSHKRLMALIPWGFQRKSLIPRRKLWNRCFTGRSINSYDALKIPLY